MIALAACLGCGTDGTDAFGTLGTSESGGPDETTSSTGAELLACEPGILSDFEITMQPAPADDGPMDTLAFRGPCDIVAVTDAPLSLSLMCPGDLPSMFELDVVGLSGSALAQHVAAGDTVELDYSARRGLDKPSSWAAVRLEGEAAPFLVVVDAAAAQPGFGGHPDFMEPLSLQFHADTDCDESPGSCNVGPERRAAVEFTVDSQSAIVFDHDELEALGHVVSVGEAVADEGNCEGINSTWYEVVILRSSAGPGAESGG